jgi:hypothetical protein
MLCTQTTPSQNKAAMAASTAEPFFIRISLKILKSVMLIQETFMFSSQLSRY